MIEVRHLRLSLLFLALAQACALINVRAQGGIPGMSPVPVLIDSRQATKLLLTQEPPDYPPVAKVNYIQGHVLVEITVDDRGKVTKAHALQGNALLATAALKATKGWVYQPLLTASGPSGFVTTVEVKFSLRHPSTELTPRQAEIDFLRQVKPAGIEREPLTAPSADPIHMRVLINDQGEVVDMDISPNGKARIAAAREALRRWIFRPAHWGSLPIASYLDVNVPVSETDIARGAPLACEH